MPPGDAYIGDINIKKKADSIKSAFFFMFLFSLGIQLNLFTFFIQELEFSNTH